MRVLLVADVVGGVRTFVQELVECSDAEFHLALLGREAVAAPRAVSCQRRELRLEWMEDPWEDLRLTAEWIEQLALAYSPDLIHMNTFAPVLDPHVPVLLTVHSCVLTWWRAVHGCPAPPAWDRYGALAQQALRRTDALTTPTHALLDDLRAVYGELPPARVVPNGRAVAATGAAVARERLVVTAGRLWDEAKNAALVARAAPAIRGRVALIGPGEVPGVQTLGALPQPELLRWLRRASVYAEPARYEPFGLAALEAAHCGCALVLGDIPSLREVWGAAAVYVDPDDAEQLASVINELLENPAPWAGAAQQRARLYAPGAMAAAYDAIYRDLAPARVGA